MPARPSKPMNFTTAKDTLFRERGLWDRLAVSPEDNAHAVEAFEEYLQLRDRVDMLIAQRSDAVDTQLVVTSSSPVARHFGFIAHDAPSTLDAATDHVAHLVLAQRVRDLVSLPEQIASLMASCGDEARGSFDRQLYLQQLSTCILHFVLAPVCQTPVVTGTGDEFLFSPSQRRCTAYELIRSCVKRGAFAFLMSALQSLSHAIWLDNTDCELNLLTVLDAVKMACYKQRLSSARLTLNAMGECWHQLLRTLIIIAQKEPVARVHVINVLCAALLRQGDSDVAKSLDVDASLAGCIKTELFSYMMTSEATTRSVLRFIFTSIVLPISESARDTAGTTHSLNYLFDEVFSKWGDKQFADKGPLDVNTTIMNAIMYSLQYLHQQGDTLAAQYLGPLLNGVTVRLDSVRSDNLRQEGMTVAAAFAAFFVPDEETTNSLFAEEQFSAALKRWCSEEASDGLDGLSVPSVHGSAASTETQQNTRRVAGEGDAFPLDPDAPFHYFKEKRDDTTRGPNQRQLTAGVAVAATRHSLPMFGVQHIEKDELGERIEPLDTLRSSYNALLGVGRHPNAQMHEVQESIENGLRGVATYFSAIKGQHAVSAEVRSEIDAMITTLLPTLLTLQIHAPEAKMKFLSQLRHQIIVDLISFSPKISLFLLSRVIYSANYSVFQRTGVIKALRQAAQQLAHVRIQDAKCVANKDAPSSALQKRLYPPIPRANVQSKITPTIVVSEGTNTRRWGRVVAGRLTQPARYENRLAEHADGFMAALLSKSDADHFKFFQEHDAYTPAEVLKTMIAVVHGTRTARHVVSRVCQEALEFLLIVIAAHPHDSVRRLAWLVTNEAMRVWCGAEPLIDGEGEEMRVAQSATAASRVHTSLMFSEEWMQSLEALQTVYVRVAKNGDTCIGVAALVISGVRDLVCEKTDLDAMQAHYNERVLEL